MNGRRLLVLALLMLVSGMAFGLLLTSRAERVPLEFVPQKLDLTSGLNLEGTTVESTVLLQNTCDRNLRVTSVNRSCGCIASEPELGNSVPFVLAAGKSLPVKIRLATLGRSGLEKYSMIVTAEWEDGREVAPCLLDIVADISVPLSAFPKRVFFALTPGQDGPIKQNVILADKWSGTDVTIRNIGTGHDGLEVSATPADEVFHFGNQTLRKRYVLTITADPKRLDDFTSDSITITTDSTLVPEIVLPIQVRRAKPFRVSPSQLTVVGPPGLPVKKVVTFLWDDGVVREVSVLDQPTTVARIECTNANEASREFEITVIPDGLTHSEVISFSVTGHQGACQVPLKIVGTKS